jgi:hypothetical protein
MKSFQVIHTGSGMSGYYGCSVKTITAKNIRTAVENYFKDIAAAERADLEEEEQAAFDECPSDYCGFNPDKIWDCRENTSGRNQFYDNKKKPTVSINFDGESVYYFVPA